MVGALLEFPLVDKFPKEEGSPIKPGFPVVSGVTTAVAPGVISATEYATEAPAPPKKETGQFT